MSQTKPVPDLVQENDEDYLARMQVEVARLKNDAQALLAELLPAVRDITDVGLLYFHQRRLQWLIDSNLWSPHTGTLQGELKICALLVSTQIYSLRNQSASTETSPEQ